jgi:hypothetical protein
MQPTKTNVCKLAYSKAKSTLLTTFETFEKLCNHREAGLIKEEQKSTIINDYAFYCGLNFAMLYFKDLIITESKRSKNVLIIDTMNIFQNIEVLIVALSVIDFTKPELEIISKIITGAGDILFDDKIKIFKKMMTYFVGTDCSIFFVLQGNKSMKGLLELEPVNKTSNCRLFLISVPCYYDEEGVRKECHPYDTKNESDDVVSLFLYHIFKSRASPEDYIMFWTYNNYDWFQGEKDKRQIQLKYMISEPNTFIQIFPGSVLRGRKDQHVRANIININGDNKYVWQESNYTAVVKAVKDKNANVSKTIIKKITDFYVHKVEEYVVSMNVPRPGTDISRPGILRPDADRAPAPSSTRSTVREGKKEDGGKFHKKYLKYKSKYTELKNEKNVIPSNNN